MTSYILGLSNLFVVRSLPCTSPFARAMTGAFALGPRTLIMGSLNVTPDSFSDGGQFFNADAGLKHALEMLDGGADILDLGGESTRPSAIPITPAEEQGRVLPE